MEELIEQAQSAEAGNHARIGLERPIFLSPLLGVQKRTTAVRLQVFKRMNKPHEIPIHVVEQINKIGGTTPDGRPLFRIVWGGERMETRCAKWKDRDDSGNIIREIVEYRQVRKYPWDRWIFEMWVPAEQFGTEVTWAAETMEIIDGIPVFTLGEFPRNGEYELLKVIETPLTKQFVNLTSTICDALIHTASRNRHIPKERKLAYCREREAKRKLEVESKESAILENYGKPFNSNPFVTVKENQ